MNDTVRKFHGVIVAVSASGQPFFIGSPDEELRLLMDGSLFEDNSAWDTIALFPKEPGVYEMTIEYQFTQGYSNGYPSDGESTWDFIPRGTKRLSLAGQG